MCVCVCVCVCVSVCVRGEVCEVNVNTTAESCCLVNHDPGVADTAKLGEEIFQFLFVGLKWKIPAVCV